MTNHVTRQKIIQFPLIKLIAGILVIGGSVALTIWISESLLSSTSATNEIKNSISGIIEITVALLSYALFVKYYERRNATELNSATLTKNALTGTLTGFGLQSLAVLVIYIAGGYVVAKVNPASFMLPAFIFAIVAGFVAEILLRGILFRCIEEMLGTAVALLIISLLFAVIHSGSKAATPLSVIATTAQAGLLLSSVYVYSRSLWFPIFLHFAWDFTEPGIYGGINPGITVDKTFLTPKIEGSALLTGGASGPGNSIQAAIFCLITGFLFLYFAKRNGSFKRPYQKKYEHR